MDGKKIIIIAIFILLLLAASFIGGYFYSLGKSTERIDDLRNTVAELQAANRRLEVQNKYALKYNKSARERIAKLESRLNRSERIIGEAKAEIRGIEEGLGKAEDTISRAIETVRRIRKIIQILAETEKSI